MLRNRYRCSDAVDISEQGDPFQLESCLFLSADSRLVNIVIMSSDAVGSTKSLVLRSEIPGFVLPSLGAVL